VSEGLRVGETLTIPWSEIRFRTSRSGGPGGQNVNKTATRVEILFDVAGSPSLSTAQRARILSRLRGYIDREGELRLVSQESSSQHRNRQDGIERLKVLLENALRPRRRRVSTRPTKASRERRLQAKRRRSLDKRQRRPVRHDD